MRLKELRKEKNITQKELAKILGFEQTIVCMWELGTREPSNETLIKMANYFNCSIDYLLGRDEVNQEKKQPEQIELKVKNDLTDKQKELLNIILDMNNDDVNKIIGYAYSLTEKELSTEEKIQKLLKEYKKNN